MNKTLLIILLFSVSTNLFAAEDWKGQPYNTDYQAGVMTGLGVFGKEVGFAAMLTGSKKIIHKGFAPDINNQVFAEIQVGPIFFKHFTPFAFSANLRWDFHKDEVWTFYGLGGWSGTVGDVFSLYPRFGIGALYGLDHHIWIRGELSHEWTTIGAMMDF